MGNTIPSLFESTEHISKAVERVLDAVRFNRFLGYDKVHVAFSGGKDSVCLYGVCKKASESLGEMLEDVFDFVYNVTTVDPPELVQFIIREFPFVKFHRVMDKDGKPLTMWRLIEQKGIYPTRLVRYCCKVFKETPNASGYTITGVRHAESSQRSTRSSFEIRGKTKSDAILLDDNDGRRETEYCMQKKVYICNPIIDWSDVDVWDFIYSENLPYCKLYDEGWTRLGCIGCPMASNKEEVLNRYPLYKRNYINAMKKANDRKRKKGLPVRMDEQEAFDWWIHEKRNVPQQSEILDLEEE